MEKKKLNYKEEQKKLKTRERVKTGIYIGLLCLALGGFTLLTVCGAKSCHNKQHQSNNTRVIGDYSLRSEKVAIDELPYKYYYRYLDNYEGYDYCAESQVYYAEFDLRLKYVSSDISGDNGYYRDLRYFALYINTRDGEVTCDLYGSETSDNIDSSANGLYFTYFDGQGLLQPESYIQIGFIDSSLDLMNYNGDNVCIGFISNIIKANAVNNLNLNFDFNTQINRYAMIGQSNTVFGRVEANSPYLGNNWCLKGYFKDGLNNYYQGIKILYTQANGTGYLDTSTNITSQQYKVFDLNGAQYTYLTFVRTDGTEVIVNKSVYIQFDNKETYTATSEWVADSFRHLTVFYLDNVNTPLPLQNYTPLEVLQMFNNNTYNNDLGGLGGATGVFGLLGQAFQSVASILNMQIIPGITLGLFIFIPFSIMILIACVWLFKR